jgi:hypothetical protein
MGVGAVMGVSGGTEPFQPMEWTPGERIRHVQLAETLQEEKDRKRRRPFETGRRALGRKGKTSGQCQW